MLKSSRVRKLVHRLLDGGCRLGWGTYKEYRDSVPYDDDVGFPGRILAEGCTELLYRHRESSMKDLLVSELVDFAVPGSPLVAVYDDQCSRSLPGTL